MIRNANGSNVGSDLSQSSTFDTAELGVNAGASGWRLRLVDAFPDDTGFLDSWSLTFHE